MSRHQFKHHERYIREAEHASQHHSVDELHTIVMDLLDCYHEAVGEYEGALERDEIKEDNLLALSTFVPYHAVFRVKLPMTTNILSANMTSWCNENLDGVYHICEIDGRVTITCSSEDDLVMTKIHFSQYMVS